MKANRLQFINPNLGDYYEMHQQMYKRFKERKIEQKYISGGNGRYYFKEDHENALREYLIKEGMKKE